MDGEGGRSLPESVLELLRERIETFEQLHVLLLLRRQPDRGWPADVVARELGLDDALVAEALEQLRRGDLIQTSGSGATLAFRYGPSGRTLQTACEALATAHAENPVKVMKTMSANAVERVRTSAMKAFANAFIVGGKKKDG